MKGNRWRWGVLAGITLLAAIFAFMNNREAVAVDFGLFVLYQVPLVWLIFFAFLLGMVTMFVIGLQQDRKIRQLLRERRLDAPPPHPVRPYPPARVDPYPPARVDGYPPARPDPYPPPGVDP